MASGDVGIKIRLSLADDGVAQRIARTGASVVGLRRELDQLAGSAMNVRQRLGDGMDSISRQLARIQSAGIAIGAVFQGAGFVGGIARTAAELESLEAAMRQVFGSAQAAQQEMARLKAESERLGVPLQTLAQAWLSFAAAARGTRLEGEAARNVFTALTEASVTLGLSQEQLSGALLAVQQMISKGAVSSEELRQQLGERLYGAVQIAARAIGLTSEEFNKLLDRGLIPVERFLPAFAEQLRRELGGGVEDAANTARAAFARLDNAFLELKLEFARSGFMDALVAAARDLTAAFKDEGFRQSVREFGQTMGALTHFVVEHGKKLVVLGGVLTGARSGAAIGRFAGPYGALIGAGVGAIAGGVGAASILPDGTASGQDERRVLDVDAAVARLKRRIQETREAAAIGLIRPDEAKRRIDEDIKTIERLAKGAAPSSASSAAADPFWRELLKKTQGGASSARDRLPALRETFDAELARLKDGLKTAESVIEESFKGRLITEGQYWQAKAETQRRALDLEARELGEKLAAQEDLIRRLAAVKPKDANQKEELAERLREANNKAQELRAQLDALDGRRVAVELAIQVDRARLDKELADIKAKLESELARATGAETPEMRLAAIRREYDDLLARFGDDPRLRDLVDKLVPVKAAQANLEAIEAQWRQVTERLRNAQDAIGIQQQAGLLTERQAREQIVAVQRESADEMARLLPAMEQAAQAIGPEAVLRVQAWRNELERTRLVTDELAPVWSRIGEAFGQAVQGIVSGAQSLREALSNIFRSIADAFLQEMVLKPFQQWVAMQARMLAVKLGLLQQEQAAETAAAAQSVATKQAEAAAKVSANAAEAGAGAAASQAAIPVVGPGLAIAAMVAMVAAVMALLGNIKKFAAGGYVTGPGSATSDSIPARLSAGEYVVRAAAVQRVGVAFLDAINGLRTPPVWDGQRLAFAAGGLVPPVSAPPAPPPVQQAVRIVNAIDPGVTHDHLQTPAGERVILNIIGRNARAVRAALQG